MTVPTHDKHVATIDTQIGSSFKSQAGRQAADRQLGVVFYKSYMRTGGQFRCHHQHTTWKEWLGWLTSESIRSKTISSHAG